MSRKSEKKEKMTGVNENPKGLARLVRKVKAFLSQRFVWLSLTVGFLWMLSVPFILTPLLEVLSDNLNQFAWIFQTAFFPFTFSLYLLSDIVPSETWIVIYASSFVISVLFCLSVAYVIHRVRIRTV
jgi:hypothetical protein